MFNSFVMQMSYLSSEKSPCRPKKTDVVANSYEDSANCPLYVLEKEHQAAKVCADSSQNSAFRHMDPISKGHMDPISKRNMDPIISKGHMDPISRGHMDPIISKGHMDPISKKKPNLTIDPSSDSKKMEQVAKIASDSTINCSLILSLRTSPKLEFPTAPTGHLISKGQMDPISKRKPNLTIDPSSGSKKMEQVAKIVSDSTSNYSLILSPRTSPKPELPTAPTGAAGLTPTNTKTNGAKTANNGQGSGNSSRSDSLESSSAPLKPHTGGDVRWDAINMVSKGSPLNLGHFQLLKRLGYGDIGNVYLVKLRGTKAYFAMKVMDKASLASRNKLLRAQTEREILGLLDHPFLPTLYSHFETDKFYCLVMEFCSGGNLHSLRQKQPNKYFTEEAAR
jgi:hypothetical protein